MTSGLATDPLLIVGAFFGVLGGALMLAGLLALRRRRPFRFVLRSLLGLLLLSLGALSASVAIGMQGYRALTREELAARVEVRPLGEQRFGATFHIPGRAESTYYELAGDALYVDAHILKWRPVVNVLGLHTAYELDRVAGRYDDLEQERSASRTVHTLAPERRIDLFALRSRYAFLAPLLDAEYGSGTFVRVNEPADFDVFVSTTGLLIRPRETAR
ncbi:MAG: hypothetical protein AB7N29_10435 [Vicinamibacterales bacterium]